MSRPVQFQSCQKIPKCIQHVDSTFTSRVKPVTGGRSYAPCLLVRCFSLKVNEMFDALNSVTVLRSKCSPIHPDIGSIAVLFLSSCAFLAHVAEVLTPRERRAPHACASNLACRPWQLVAPAAIGRWPCLQKLPYLFLYCYCDTAAFPT